MPMMRKKLNWNPLDRRGSFPYYYAILPVAGTLVCNMFTYYGSRPITQGLPHWDLTLPLDRWIPFVPSAVSIYVLAFVSWVIGIWVIARESPAVCYEVLAGEQIAKLLCLVCFFLLPTTMERPEVPGSDPFSWLVRFIYQVDTPDNLLPSIHCLENWLCFRGALRCRKVGRGYQIGMLIFAILVFASTLLVKQHLVLDVVTGIAVVEIGLFLARRTGAGRIYAHWNRRLGIPV